MLDICFSNETSGRNIDAASTLLLQPRLWTPHGDYPAHTEWVDKAVAEIEYGQKRAMIAQIGNDPVGILVYQRHKTHLELVEIKNLSVERQARGRRIADFLFRQVELEASHDFPGTIEIVGDTKLTNEAMIRFAVHNGMTATISATPDSQFAHNGIADVVFTKPI